MQAVFCRLLLGSSCVVKPASCRSSCRWHFSWRHPRPMCAPILVARSWAWHFSVDVRRALRRHERFHVQQQRAPGACITRCGAPSAPSDEHPPATLQQVSHATRPSAAACFENAPGRFICSLTIRALSFIPPMRLAITPKDVLFFLYILGAHLFKLAYERRRARSVEHDVDVRKRPSRCTRHASTISNEIEHVRRRT